MVSSDTTIGVVWYTLLDRTSAVLLRWHCCSSDARGLGYQSVLCRIVCSSEDCTVAPSRQLNTTSSDRMAWYRMVEHFLAVYNATLQFRQCNVHMYAGNRYTTPTARSWSFVFMFIMIITVQSSLVSCLLTSFRPSHVWLADTGLKTNGFSMFNTEHSQVIRYRTIIVICRTCSCDFIHMAVCEVELWIVSDRLLRAACHKCAVVRNACERGTIPNQRRSRVSFVCVTTGSGE